MSWKPFCFSFIRLNGAFYSAFMLESITFEALEYRSERTLNSEIDLLQIASEPPSASHQWTLTNWHSWESFQSNNVPTTSHIVGKRSRKIDSFHRLYPSKW